MRNDTPDTSEHVVLVDDDGTVTGTMPKSEAHHADTPLHLAFSIFLFNSRGELLLQQRAFSKKTWPGVWSNSCCGHPMPDEITADGARRRLEYELGITSVELIEMLPDYRYRAELDGIVENEICPVFVCFTDQPPVPNEEEVAAVKWTDWVEFLSVAGEPDPEISPWSAEEAVLLDRSPRFNELYRAHTASPAR